MQRVILLVLDGFGVGELPDAALYNDKGSNTLKHICCKYPKIKIPNLRSLGLFNIPGSGAARGIPATAAKSEFIGSFGKSAIKSKGKDSTTGHWEMAGLILNRAFPLYPNGFPKSVIKKFEKAVERKVIWNLPASGSEIINKLGQTHLETGGLIVYTSADSVFQIAAHEKLMPVPQLYRCCRAARSILCGRHAVGRVIARPFLGKDGNFYRTSNRKDYSLPPVKNTVLDALQKIGVRVEGVGKINDLFCGKGISSAYHTNSNIEGIKKTIELIKHKKDKQFIFTNLVDFDMLYGHRNDCKGYAAALEELDSMLPKMFKVMKADDILIITSDHGCDPLTPSTDHSREYVPLLVYGRGIKQGFNLGVRKSLTDISASLAEAYGIKNWRSGRSFLSEIKL